jgi:MYXO-CTERM domain-containing protein
MPPCIFNSLEWSSSAENVQIVESVPALVTIDIKPGSDSNSVNPKSKGVIPVAVLGSMDFDATQVDFSTVTFGPDGASPAHDGHVEDVNDDSFMDMMFHFKTQETGIARDDTDATLMGETFGGTNGGTKFMGMDTVKTVGCKGKSSAKVNATTSEGAGALSWMLLVGLGVLGLWRLNRRVIRSN